MLNVRKAWYLDALPNHIAIELENHEIKLAQLAPYRHVTEKELTNYYGHAPERCKSAELRPIIYRSYGLRKITEG